MVCPKRIFSTAMSPEVNAPIGVFDSGIGGLSVLKALRAEMPQQDFIYIADSGHAPYGERDEAHVIARSSAIAAHLVGQRVKALVMACNTATAAAIHLLRAAHPHLPIIGVEPALKPAVVLSKTRRIGIMATRNTLNSTKFRKLLEAHAGQASFVLQPCDGLADAIERSANSGDATEIIAACARHTGAMGRFGLNVGDIDTLVLGCTHYPFALPHLQALLPPEITYVDTGEAVARQTARLTGADAQAHRGESRPGWAGASSGQISLGTTSQPQSLQVAAERWLGLQASALLLSI